MMKLWLLLIGSTISLIKGSKKTDQHPSFLRQANRQLLSCDCSDYTNDVCFEEPSYTDEGSSVKPSYYGSYDDPCKEVCCECNCDYITEETCQQCLDLDDCDEFLFICAKECCIPFDDLTIMPTPSPPVNDDDNETKKWGGGGNGSSSWSGGGGGTSWSGGGGGGSSWGSGSGGSKPASKPKPAPKPKPQSKYKRQPAAKPKPVSKPKPSGGKYKKGGSNGGSSSWNNNGGNNNKTKKNNYNKNNNGWNGNDQQKKNKKKYNGWGGETGYPSKYGGGGYGNNGRYNSNGRQSKYGGQSMYRVQSNPTSQEEEVNMESRTISDYECETEFPYQKNCEDYKPSYGTNVDLDETYFECCILTYPEYYMDDEEYYNENDEDEDELTSSSSSSGRVDDMTNSTNSTTTSPSTTSSNSTNTTNSNSNSTTTSVKGSATNYLTTTTYNALQNNLSKNNNTNTSNTESNNNVTDFEYEEDSTATTSTTISSNNTTVVVANVNSSAETTTASISSNSWNHLFVIATVAIVSLLIVLIIGVTRKSVQKCYEKRDRRDMSTPLHDDNDGDSVTGAVSNRSRGSRRHKGGGVVTVSQDVEDMIRQRQREQNLTRQRSYSNSASTIDRSNTNPQQSYVGETSMSTSTPVSGMSYNYQDETVGFYNVRHSSMIGDTQNL